MNSPVDSTHPDWNAWATLANDVGRANRTLSDQMTFTDRHVLARALWDMGYRPKRDAEVWDEGYRFASGRTPLAGYNPYCDSLEASQ